MSKSTFSLPRSGSALALCAALALPGCQQASAPPAEPEPTPPVLQAGQLHYASNHPQLALLAVTEACPASVLRRHPDCTLYLDAESASEWVATA